MSNRLSPDVSIIVPTFNERENIRPFTHAIESAMGDTNWEIIFVDDDSRDGTGSEIQALASEDPRIRYLLRLGRRGLASACIEGVLASTAPCLCIMDVDLQHDESRIPGMLSRLKERDLDLVVASRYTDEGGTGTLPRYRRIISNSATRFSHLCFRVDVTDPMSGFFVFSRTYFERVMRKLSGRGFKILLDMLLVGEDKPAVAEVPYTMRHRAHGESKLGMLVVWDFMMLIAYRLLGRIFPYRFMSYIAVGGSGLLLHMLALWLLHEMNSVDFTVAQTLATFIAMTSNYVLNNIFTYYDNRQSGKYFWRGLLVFYLVCLFGAILNIALASKLYDYQLTWFLAGSFGAIAGAIWNFTVSRFLVWRQPGRTNAQGRKPGK